MYYSEYDDYMKSVLGYQNLNDNTYCNNCNYRMDYDDMDYNNYRRTEIENIEQMYPDIYRVINPMVCKACDNNTQPVTEYLIEQMTDDIYDNAVKRIEIKNVINLNIETREVDEGIQNARIDSKNDLRENSESRGSTNTLNSSNNISKTNNMSNKNSINSVSNIKQNEFVSNNRSVENESRDDRSPIPRRRNTLLRDLIRILIINRILRIGRPGQNRPPYRPPFRPGSQPIRPRPPMPGGPGFGPGPMQSMPPRPPMPRFDEYEW